MDRGLLRSYLGGKLGYVFDDFVTDGMTRQR